MWKNKRGAILLEALLAIVVFTIVIITVIPLLSFLLRRTERSKYEAQAALLMQEAQEVAYNIIQTNWNSYGPGIYQPARSVTSWRLLPGEESNLETRFTRKITINYGCRSDTGVLDYTLLGACPTLPDQNTKVVTAEISWEEGEALKKLVSNLTLVNFKE